MRIMLIVLTGGSFGVVYKAIEKETGDIVAIKHVCGPLVIRSIDFNVSAD